MNEMAMSINRVTLLGAVGKDPEIRAIGNGSEVANFSVATTESWKDKSTGEKKERTEWHKITVWGPLVGVVRDRVKKGTKIFVEGQLQTRKWQAPDGSDRYSTEIVLQGPSSTLMVISGSPVPSQQGQGQHSRSVGEEMDDSIPF